MTINTQNSKLKSLLLVLLSFAIVLFVTKGQFYNYTQNSNITEGLKVDLQAKDTELNNLTILEKELTNGDKKKEIQGFSSTFSEDAMIKYLYDYSSKDQNGIEIKSVSLKDNKKGELGFNEASINLDVSIDSKEDLTSFLTFLTSRNSQYTFFINNFSFNYSSVFDSTYDISIPLKLLYK